ncbi:ankyrin [Aureobasidium pullulans]|uniref:Ankyrin n=1 Tax=Aureobasidium pullulans TaxID=5580 RepID=A0A4T0AAV5_AURPU|nr:ankyrin [Aureobasidium pullulans]TIA17689.1 ankyrin [Aureobasidium pullulans]
MDTTELDDSLYRACIAEDLAQVKLLIQEQNAQVDKIIGPPGQLDYCLNHATKTGSVPLVRFLLEQGGAPVNAGALRIAAFGGDLPMLQLLLEPIKAHLTTLGMSRKWRGDLASILVGTTRRGRSETAEALKVFRTRIDDFDKSVDAGLLAACAAGDMRSVRYFVGLGAGNKVEALSTAAEYHQFEPLQYFLENYSFEPEDLGDPLISAAVSGDMDSILLLIEHGAEDESGAALSKTAKFSHTEAAQHFLNTFRYTTDKLSTALSAAARTADTNVMNMLIQRGARGSGALIVAVQRSHLSATELLIRDLSPTQAELSKALEKAMFIWLRPVQTSRPYLSRASSFSSKSTNDGIEPPTTVPEVLKSREVSRRRIVEVLLAAGGRLSELYYCRLLEMMILTQNQYGVELLHNNAKYTTVDTLPDAYLISLAIYHQQDAMVDLFLEFPIMCNQSAGETEETIDLSSVQTIAEKTVAWESKVYNPIPSPLIMAAKSRNEQWARALINHEETDINEWCSYKPTKRLLSFYGSDQKTQTPREEQYEELGCPFGTESLRDCALSMAVRSGDLPIIRMLIESGADPWVNRQGISTLELAAQTGCLPEIVLSLENSTPEFKIDRKEWDGGKSMLHWAAMHGDGDIINLLCKKGATVDLSDGMHKTPLHSAVAAGNIDTVKSLLWAGASTSRRDVEDSLCVDELAAKLAQEAFWSDELRAVRFEISHFLKDWVRNNMDRLDAANIRRESKAAEEKAKVDEASQSVGDDLLDHFSDDDSVHWSEGE